MYPLKTPVNRRIPPTPEELENYDTQITGLSNQELFYEFEGWANPDDYGGEWTAHAGCILNALRAELVKRLINTGFLSDGS